MTATDPINRRMAATAAATPAMPRAETIGAPERIDAIVWPMPATARAGLVRALELAEIVGTPLTVIAPDATQMSDVAVRLLWRRLDGFAGPAERVILPTRLIARPLGRGQAGAVMAGSARDVHLVDEAIHPMFTHVAKPSGPVSPACVRIDGKYI